MRARFAVIACMVLAILVAPVDADHINEGDVRFKVTCGFDHTAPDDPIVFPDQPGASHSHDFFGNREVTAFITNYSELQEDPDVTTCNDAEDLAVYWTPTVSMGGSPVEPIRMTAYYRRGEKHGDISAYPNGLKIVAEGGSTGWQCNGTNTVRSTPLGCTTDLTMRINFPDCWDGVNRDFADHRSHMAYSTPSGDHNVCPAAHPVQVPGLTTNTHYGNVTGPVTISASTVHGDFFNGWVRTRLVERIETCLNGLQFCPSGG